MHMGCTRELGLVGSMADHFPPGLGLICGPLYVAYAYGSEGLLARCSIAVVSWVKIGPNCSSEEPLRWSIMPYIWGRPQSRTLISPQQHLPPETCLKLPFATNLRVLLDITLGILLRLHFTLCTPGAPHPPPVPPFMKCRVCPLINLSR